MKWLIAALAATLVSGAFAAFDLQQISRYSVSGIAPTSFTHVAKRPGGGFVVAGQLGHDIVVAQFDSYGGLTRTALWDSPLQGLEAVAGLHVDAQNRTTLVASDGLSQGGFVIQFSPSLVPNWTVQRAEAALRSTMDGSGVVYVRYPNLVVAYNSAGTSLGQMVPTQSLMAGIQGPSGSGFYMAGRSALGRPFVARYDSSCSTIYEVEAATTQNSEATYADLAALDDGGAVLVGTADLDTPLVSELTLAGSLTSRTPSPYNKGLTKVRVVDANRVLCVGPVGTIMVNRQTGAIQHQTTFSSAFVDAYAALPSQDRAVFSLSNNAVNSSPLTGGGIESTWQVPGRLVAWDVLAPDLAAGVGTASQSGLLAFSDGQNLGWTSYRFTGSITRFLNDSVPFADGDIALLGPEFRAEGSTLYVTRYRPNGTLRYARYFTLPPGVGNSVAEAGLNDTLSVAGLLQSSDAWFFLRLSPTGTALVTATLPNPSSFDPKFVRPLADGSVAVVGNSTEGWTYYRLSSAGQVLAKTVYPESSVSLEGAHLGSNGVLTVSSIANPGRVVKVRRIDTLTGASLGTADLNSGINSLASTFDNSGALTVAYANNLEVTLERRNSTTLALLNTRTLPGNWVNAVAASPNGNVVVSQQSATSVQELRIYGAGNFPDVGSGQVIANFLPTDLKVGASNLIYLFGQETQGATINGYAARYLANGVRGAQRRVAGQASELNLVSDGVWITGTVPTYRKGTGPFAARYSL